MLTAKVQGHGLRNYSASSTVNIDLAYSCHHTHQNRFSSAAYRHAAEVGVETSLQRTGTDKYRDETSRLSSMKFVCTYVITSTSGQKRRQPCCGSCADYSCISGSSTWYERHWHSHWTHGHGGYMHRAHAHWISHSHAHRHPHAHTHARVHRSWPSVLILLR